MDGARASAAGSGRGSGRGRDEGVILIFTVIALLLIAGLSAAFMNLSLHSSRSASAQTANSNAFYVAESALDEAVLRINHRYNNTVWDPTDLDSRFAELDAIDPPDDGAETVFRDPLTGALFQNFPIGRGTATVWVAGAAAVIRDPDGRELGRARDLQISSTGSVDGISLSVQRHLRYQIKGTRKFDFALLAEELPECMLCHLEVRGDAGQVASGRFKLWSPYDRHGFERSAVHGDLYLRGTFAGESLERQGDSRGREQERLVTDQGGSIFQGFSGEKLAAFGPLAPHFEPGKWYDTLSEAQNSSIRLDASPARDLGDAVANRESFLGVVPRGLSLDLTSPAVSQVGPVVEGHLVLAGTPSNPVRVDKSVTVHGDVVIKGTVTGTGNLAASGNIFIVDSLRYARPPQNPLDARAGAAGGGPADKLGLTAGGSILIGDLTDPRTARFLNLQFVDAAGSGYEWVPADYLNHRYVLDGNREPAPRAVGDHAVISPGLLPEGAAGGFYSPLLGVSYIGGWMPWTILDQLSNHNLDHVDATLYANWAIAGGQPEAATLLSIHGGAVAPDVNLLSAKRNSPAGFAIRYDNRNRDGNPMGFPVESAIFETGWFRIPPKT